MRWLASHAGAWCVLFCFVAITGCVAPSERSTAVVTTTSSPTVPASPPPPGATPASPPPPSPTTTPSPELAAIQLLTARVGFVSGYNTSGLAKTTDGGATWQHLPIPRTQVQSIRFIDQTVGWVVGFKSRDVPSYSCQQAAPVAVSRCQGVVLNTRDGGATWAESLSIPTDGIMGNPIRQLQAVRGNQAWALVNVGSGCDGYGCAELRGTLDSGRTWVKLAGENIIAMRFATAMAGWIVTEGNTGPVVVSGTSDGGRTWVKQLSVPSRAFVGFDAAAASSAWLMTRDPSSCTSSNCSSDHIYRTENSGQSWEELDNPKVNAGDCSFGVLAGPLFASPTRGWLTLSNSAGGVRVRGGLISTFDGGRTWECSTEPSNVRLITAADPLHLWIGAGGSGTVAALYSTSDSGVHWLPVDLAKLGEDISK